jgi:molybdopterin molybdotransferase
MLAPADAARLIVAHLAPLQPARCPLRDALDRVLGEDVFAPLDLPPWDNSAMDGYAVRAADVRDASAARPAVLRVIESVAAGAFPTHAVGPGEATRIFTGAPLPDGADTVVRQEDTELGEAGAVVVRDGRDAGRNVRRRGEDVRREALVLRAGTPLGPAELGLLASLAHGAPLAHLVPHVAFLGSGDEIADLDEELEILAGKKIASSNSYTLHAMIRRAGAEPRDLGIARDSAESLRQHLARARGANLLVTTAGVSVGEHDLVRGVLEELGGTLRFWRVQMRPGAPLGFGTLGDLPWIGLPGNPVSTMVTFELFVRPAIRRLAGHALPFRRTVPVTVREPITLGPRLRHYLRAVVTEPRGPDGGREAVLTGPQGSGILTSMVKANALLVVPADRPNVAAGETLTALLLDDAVHTAEPTF